ncbi:MAG: hypothetical protein AAF518_17360 [Spirochaetota bacterium]
MPAIFECKSLFFCPPEKLFQFHEEKIGFETLVGADKNVQVVSAPTSLAVGQTAHLQVSILPFVKVDWIARHTQYEKNKLFQDVQDKGPFQKFEHSHRFEVHPQGAILTDHIEFDFFLSFISRYFVAIKLKAQFKERHRLTAKALGVNFELQSCGLVTNRQTSK